MCCAVAQHEKDAGRPLSHRQLPVFSAATWMTSLILQNFYGTLQACYHRSHFVIHMLHVHN